MSIEAFVTPSSFLINDLFWTHQGEGQHAGRRALFIRLPYCNLKCSWCDTSFNSYKKFQINEFVDYCKLEKARFAVVTGGEPTMNKQTPDIARVLKSLGFEIAIESNGTFPIPAGIDFVTISPKRDAKYEINKQAFGKANEFKYVVDQGFDFSILQRHDTSDGRRYSLSPEFNNWKESVAAILKYTQEDPSWRISLQTHKILSIP